VWRLGWFRPGREVRALRSTLPTLAIGAGSLLALVVAVCVPLSAPAGGSKAAAAPSNTVWLCRPGQANDPCTSKLAATAVSANGATTPLTAAPVKSSKFDCFFIYPTVSGQLTENANLKVQQAEIGAAEDEAARFSQVCEVWAPMYRQRTEYSLTQGLGNEPKADEVAYQSVLTGWKDYLAHDNHGRPIIFIGHSQGAAMLIRLLHNVIDPNPKLRARMVSAVILGGNVQVPTGKTVGGSFQHIPICTSVKQTGCVIAYSTFGSQPPLTALFSRPGEGVSLQSGQTTKTGQQVACVNPVNFSNASGSLLPYFLTVGSTVPGLKITTPWVTYPGLYTATCESNGGATWLQINASAVPGDPRPKVTAALGPNWGYHLDDVSLALGNLVFDVAVQENAYH
jgi:hypothetical protein